VKGHGPATRWHLNTARRRRLRSRRAGDTGDAPVHADGV